MNIEKEIPEHILNRKDYLKNVVLDKIYDYLGINGEYITYKFEGFENTLAIQCKGVILLNRGHNRWSICNADEVDFLPKEYLLLEWEEFQGIKQKINYGSKRNKNKTARG